MEWTGKAVGISLILALALTIAGLAAPAACAAQTSARRQSSETLRDPSLPLPTGRAARLDRANAPVQFLAPGQVTVAADHPVVVDLEFRVANGLHINSHSPHDKNLVPARLAVVEGGGLDVTRVDFPPGADYAFAFAPKEKLSVYTGEFVLRAHLTAKRGEHSLRAELQYQACDMNSCRPPASLPVTVRILAK